MRIRSAVPGIVFASVLMHEAVPVATFQSPGEASAADLRKQTSPLWQNHYSTTVGNTNWGAGVYTEEANRLIAPLLRVLKAYFDSRK
jgi:hypothetical protein